MNGTSLILAVVGVFFSLQASAVILVDENYDSLSNGQTLPGWTDQVYFLGQVIS
ncbi:MAG: hypothetical protein AB1656_19755 [Candidatus Omnitrophota bacterium]